jgi:pyruvate/oxaloacetate carboxyltransferase
MLSNLVNQLRAAKAEHRLPAVLEEMPRVRQDRLSALVTPTSQIVARRRR